MITLAHSHHPEDKNFFPSDISDKLMTLSKIKKNIKAFVI